MSAVKEPSSEIPASNVIWLSERLKASIGKSEDAIQAQMPDFNLSGTGTHEPEGLSSELSLLKDYLGMLAVKMTEKAKAKYASSLDTAAAAFLIRCHRKAEWAEKRAMKLERKLAKTKRKAKRG